MIEVMFVISFTLKIHSFLLLIALKFLNHSLLCDLLLHILKSTDITSIYCVCVCVCV